MKDNQVKKVEGKRRKNILDKGNSMWGDQAAKGNYIQNCWSNGRIGQDEARNGLDNGMPLRELDALRVLMWLLSFSRLLVFSF